MKMHEAAERSLTELAEPTHLARLVDYMEDRGYFRFGAQDPARALGVCLDRRSKGTKYSGPYGSETFYRSSPATYGLLDWLEDSSDLDLDERVEQVLSEEDQHELEASLFLEEELHRWLFKNLEKNGLEALGFGPLRLFAPKDQQRQGKYRTAEVGEIDMLLLTEADTLLVVELKRRSTDSTIGQICRYVGWVESCLAEEGQAVRGLVLAQEVSPSLQYAIKATREIIEVQQLTIDVTLGDRFR